MRQRTGQFGFFDLETQLEKIYQLDDFFLKLDILIYWELFCNDLHRVREREKENPPNVGRPPYDVVLMFRILTLK